jgi:serine/threonine protein kinase
VGIDLCSPSPVLRVFCRRAMACDSHAVALVHRDSKPDNLMVGEDGRVRVMTSAWLVARANIPGSGAEEATGVPQHVAPVSTIRPCIRQFGRSPTPARRRTVHHHRPGRACHLSLAQHRRRRRHRLVTHWRWRSPAALWATLVIDAQTGKVPSAFAARTRDSRGTARLLREAPPSGLRLSGRSDVGASAAADPDHPALRERLVDGWLKGHGLHRAGVGG